MNLSRIFLSLITSFLTVSMLLSNLCYALDTGGTSFMDLKSSATQLQSLINKNIAGTVSVSVFDDTGVLKGSGSGFFIDNEGRIITNASIWRDAYSAEVLSHGNSYREVSIISLNDERDIALIKVNATNEFPLELDFNNKTSSGERVIVIGKMTNSIIVVSEGLISSFIRADEDFDLIEIQTTAPILHYENSSDGPVFNAAGKVIGIAGNASSENKISGEIWWGFSNDTLYAISINSIRILLSEAGKIEHLYPAKSKIWYKWFVSSMKAVALKGFLYLYDIGFNKVIAFLFVSILILYIIEKFYVKYIKHRYGR